MKDQLELKFVEYDIESFFSTCLNVINQGAKNILLRPFNEIAYDLVKRLHNNDLPVSFYAIKKELEISPPENVQLLETDISLDAAVLFTSDEKDLSSLLMEYIDLKRGVIIAPISKYYFKNKPLFLVSIPKSGTHLLYELAGAFGYQPGIVCSHEPLPGLWYCIEYSNSHTSARDFFVDTVRRRPFGNRDHPFLKSPTLFIYRNPLDIVVSEAHYYHKEGNTAFFGYLSNRSFEERLLTLIDDPWLFGSIRDRVGNFIPWLEFGNVIPVSFEELIGPKGGGSIESLTRLIWSLQLKLHIPGSPILFGNKAFTKSSPTFYKGQIGSYLDHFTDKAYEKFYNLSQDFMELLGYNFPPESKPGKVPRRAEEFRKRPVVYSEYDFDQIPITVIHNYLDHNIVKYKGEYYIIPHKIGSINYSNIDYLEKIKKESSPIIAKQYISLCRWKNISIKWLHKCIRNALIFITSAWSRNK